MPYKTLIDTMKIRIPLFLVLLTGALATTFIIQAQTQESMTTTDKAPEQPQKPVVKTDAQWRKLLTPEQYRIARQSGTERPNGEVYQQFKKQTGKNTHLDRFTTSICLFQDKLLVTDS